MKNEFLSLMKSDAALVEGVLKSRFDETAPQELHDLQEAQKYSLFAGGKRIRPIIVLAFCRLFGGADEAALPYAAAVEMMHTASLIHDDLPAIDNDDLRRGMPTSHKKFGESVAILAADGLFMDAFYEVASNPFVSASVTKDALRVFTYASGTRGLVGGEYVDVASEGKKISLDTLKIMHSMKTGALICASAQLGALAAGVSLDSQEMRDVSDYAESIGLAFQVLDDVLDVYGNTEELGKNIGSDKERGKNTFLNFLSLDEAVKYSQELTARGVEAIEKYKGSEFLCALAHYLSERKS